MQTRNKKRIVAKDDRSNSANPKNDRSGSAKPLQAVAVNNESSSKDKVTILAEGKPKLG